MAHRFLVKDIAFQAGVATATVDRALHNRGKVRQQTVDRIRHAIEELEQQSDPRPGRLLVIDFIIEAPASFCHLLNKAISRVLPLMDRARFRARTDMRLHFNETEMERVAQRVLRRGSDGVVLMAPDTVRMERLVARLADAKIPVVTFATDLPRSGRISYVGLNNRLAGRTAALLMSKWLTGPCPHVLVTIRNGRFRGEGDRATGFRDGMEAHFAAPAISSLTESGPGQLAIAAQVRTILLQDRKVDAIYSIGGSNRQIFEVLAEFAHRPVAFIAHDLDEENRDFLRAGLLDAVLDHDFEQDVEHCLHRFLQHYGMVQGPPRATVSQIRIIVPTMLADPEGHS